jgi:hypothetical protein
MSKIQKAKPQPARTIVFSFQFIIQTGDEYALDKVSDPLLRTMILKFHEYGNLEPQHLRNSANHCHPIDWEDSRVTRHNGFAHLDDQKRSYPAWQLYITTKARIHGFLAENTFYIVWFDPKHTLYRRKK